MRLTSNVIINFLNRECKNNMHTLCHAKWDGLGFSVECMCNCHYKNDAAMNGICAGEFQN